MNGHTMLPVERRTRALALALVVIVAAFGFGPGAAAHTVAQAPPPSQWFEPLPGYDPNEIPHGPWLAYTYEQSPLIAYADQDPPKPEEYEGLRSKRSYPAGSRERMLASWKEKIARFPRGISAAELKARWKTFVEDYVGGVESNTRGEGYAKFVYEQELGITDSPDYNFDKPTDEAPVRPDAMPTKPNLKRGFEVKDAVSLSPRAVTQLEGYIMLVDNTGIQIIYIFRQRPDNATLNKIKAANERVAVNRNRKPGEPLVPAIVVRIVPAIPQGIPGKAAPPPGAGAPNNATPNATPDGNAPARGDPVPPVPPRGGGGVLAAPGAGQLPIDGGLAEAIANSTDTSEQAAEKREILESMAADTGNEDLGADRLGGVDFSTLELRYVSDTYQGGSGLGYAFSANPAPEGQPAYGGRRAALLASDAFFVWLALPTSDFTVNLNPDEPDRIMDAKFGRTDAGRVLLEADLQMKKTVAKLIHPDTPAGARYWAALQGETKCSTMRQWIVPGPASVREDKGQLYILDAPLQVKMETDYVKAKGVGDGCQGQSPEATANNERLYRTTILPQVEKAVNTAPEYADLRRVYVSRVAAQWYRERSLTKKTAYSDLIDSGDVRAWPLRRPWTPKETFDRYVESYTNGEFKVTQSTTKGDYIETYIYLYGGVDLTNIPRLKMSDSTFSSRYGQLPETVGQAMYRPVQGQGGDRVWLGGETTSRPLPEIQAGVPSPLSRPGFWILALLPSLLWVAGGALLLARRLRHDPNQAAVSTTAVTS